MINEKELEEVKEKICKLATKPREAEWLRRKTGASQELFEEALDDLTDSRHVKEDEGEVTALKPYSKSKVTVNYCPKCGSRIVGDECPVCRAKVTSVEQHALGGTIIKVVMVTFLLVAFMGIVSTPRLGKTAPMIREEVYIKPQMVEEARYAEAAYERMRPTQIEEDTIFSYTEFRGEYCEEEGRPIVYHFGKGPTETEMVIKELATQFPVSVHMWPDPKKQGIPPEDIEVLERFGGGMPMTLFGCRYVAYGEIRWDQMPQAAAILCDITGHGSRMCEDHEVQRYIDMLYSRFPERRW